MANEIIEGVEEIEEIKEEEPKPELTPEQIRGIKQRQFTKLAKELGHELPKESKSVEEPTKVQKEGFDYAELAYLSVKGVSDEDISFVEETIKNTGKSLKDLLTTKWFKEELKEKEDARKTKEAIPSGSKRSTVADKTEKDYWIAKIDSGNAKLSDITDTKLRREVNNARIQREGDGGRFATKSVISGSN